MAYRSVLEIPGPVDHVIFSTPALLSESQELGHIYGGKDGSSFRNLRPGAG
jgi:hypothetical protein